jgi:hypothetical protein
MVEKRQISSVGGLVPVGRQEGMVFIRLVVVPSRIVGMVLI